MKKMKKTVNLTFLIVCLLFSGFKSTDAKTVKDAKNVIAFSESGKCAGWPSNNGIWSWDDGREILMGFTLGDFMEQKGHNIKGHSDAALGYVNALVRSHDGGRTWKIEEPKNFVGSDGKVKAIDSPAEFNFEDSNFAMRIIGIGYHGSQDSVGSFIVSNDRGRTWQGAYRFGKLMEDVNLQGMELTARTSYLATGQKSCLLFMAARPKASTRGQIATDKSFVAETTDGGKTFQFISWIVPLNDPYRAVMPAATRLKDGTIVAVLRRRDITNDPKGTKGLAWVDCYGSNDNGRTWSYLNRVGETGKANGNPPGITVLKDGRVVCAYGDRTRGKMFARVSSDGGMNWGAEIVLRDDFQPDKFGDLDFGYPQLTTNHRGEVIALYYWATKELIEHHIAGTIFKIKNKK
jgi:photosystem II stability/assembly factor-like uncharacterized protein